MTTPPLPSPLDASQTTYGFPTPSPALLDHPALKDTHTPPHTHEVLPDLDKTPTMPRVMKITEAEAYVLKVRAANDTDAHVVTGVNITTEQFESNISKSKDIVGEIVDEEIPASSPALLSKPWTFTEDQIGGLEVEPTTEGLLQGLRHSTDYVRAQSSKLSGGFRTNLSEILNNMARITPRMATNPEVIARSWHFSEAATYHTPVDIPPPPPAKKVTFAPTPIPTSTSVPIPMEVDASPSPVRIPAALKGKGKAPPPPPTPQNPIAISPVIASPIKVSAVPKPLAQPSKTGNKATNETRVGVTPCMPESGNRRHAMGKDASGSNAPSANAVTAAGRARDANGSHAPQNPPTSGKNAP
ncbi:hypothetical protein AGABI1DRAFT_96128, partial [Agaricus bisporus var. burnettii JB137-S8]